MPFCAVLIYERVSPAGVAKHVCHWARNPVIGELKRRGKVDLSSPSAASLPVSAAPHRAV